VKSRNSRGTSEYELKIIGVFLGCIIKKNSSSRNILYLSKEIMFPYGTEYKNTNLKK
jgi:hypothetical protein